jgi:hypothetical protein
MRINAKAHLCNGVEIESGQLDRGKERILDELGKRAIKPCSPKNSSVKKILVGIFRLLIKRYNVFVTAVESGYCSLTQNQFTKLEMKL